MALLLALPLASYADGNVDKEAKEQNTPEGWTPVELPQLPEITATNTFDITKYGASTTSEDNTEAIQAALNAVPSTGGMVVIPAGEWLCGPITMKSKTVLHLAANATLKLLPYGKYPVSKVEGNKKSYDNFISNGKSEITDAIVEGEDKNTSIIEGQGGPWWDVIETDEKDNISRGAVIRFTKGSRFLIRNLTVQNAPGVNITISQNGKASHGTIHDVIIREPSSSAADPSHNTDGISMWGHHINIYNCDISNGDDNVVADTDAQYVHVWNCRFGDGHGASIGSFTENLHDILYEDITFNGTDSGFRLKSQRDRSGDVYNITFRNCTMTGVKNPVYIECWYDHSTKPEPSEAEPAEITATTPAYRDILIQNVVSTGTPYNTSHKAYFPIYIYGLPESHVKNVTFDNVQIEAQKGMFLAYCDNVEFKNGCKITNSKNPSELLVQNYKAKIVGDYTGDSYNPGEGDPVTFTLDADTGKETPDKATTWTFNNGCTITSEKGDRGYATAKNNTLKYSKGYKFFINLPENVTITTVIFTGYCNGTNGCYLEELNGLTFPSDKYPFPSFSGSGNPTLETYSIDLAHPATGSISFKCNGTDQAALSIMLKGIISTGIENITTTPTQHNGKTYNLQGMEVKEPLAPGIYIRDGKKFIKR